MQASTYGSIREKLVFGVKVQQQRRVLGFGDFRRTSLCMTDKATVLTSAMGAKLARPGIGFDGISMNSLKPRSLRAQASGMFIIQTCFRYLNYILLWLVEPYFGR